MLVNFENLNFGDCEETFKGKKERDSGFIFCRINAVWLNHIDVDDEKMHIVRCDAEDGPDPKIHFRTFQEAKKFYDVLVEGLKDSVSFKEIDVLKFGAI